VHGYSNEGAVPESTPRGDLRPAIGLAAYSNQPSLALGLQGRRT
jgi:hypothetical protein